MIRPAALPARPAADHRARRRRPVGVVLLLPLLLGLAACADREDSDAISMGGGGAGDAGGDPGDTSDPATPAVPLPPTVAPPVATGGDGDGSDDGTLARADVREPSESYAYRRNGPYASVLAGCAQIEFETADDACSLQVLPFVSQTTPSPTVEDVMNRVVVTHDWMGANFETLIRSREAELLPLFGSVTSILIGSTVRPSFYWAVTGGVRLDPAGLWLTVAEKANISIEEDFRAEFRAKLAFRNFWTLQRDGQRAVQFFDLEDDSERTLADIEISMMSLLFHELAHANDFLPPGGAASLDASLQPLDALLSLEDSWLSPSLDARLPLNSTLLKELAEVRFSDREATPAQAAVTATTAGGEFAFDGGSYFYSYFTIREDFANQFETLIMKRLFDIDTTFAFVDQPADPENAFCEDFTVGWGMRNRLGDPTVAARARDVVESIYGPDPSLDTFIAAQANTATLMTPGVDWCTNLAGGTTMAFRARQRETTAMREMTGHAERHAQVEALRRGR